MQNKAAANGGGGSLSLFMCSIAARDVSAVLPFEEDGFAVVVFKDEKLVRNKEKVMWWTRAGTSDLSRETETK